jgi:hypothetical protein
MYDNIRISDAEREQVTARLREHFAEGRLSSEELDERVTATLSAKTYGDLNGIMADLPEPGSLGPQPPQPGPVPSEWTARPVYYRRRPRFLPVALLILFAALVLPGAGWAFFAFIKIALLAWLVMCIAGIVTASRIRRRVRHSGRYGYGEPWRR